MKQLNAAFAFLAVLVVTPAIYAQTNRTWVSNIGDDASSCSRTAPCKTLAGAISKTAAGGKISVLDSGDFDTVTITKAITINGDDTFSSSINGVIVNAGPNDRVILRNLSINSVGTGIKGIRFLTGKSLTVDHVNISGLTGRGIDVSLATTGDLYVKDSTITNAATGIRISTTGAFVLAMLENVHLEGNGTGLEVANNSRASISNSVVSGNTQNGILASGSNTEINVVGCRVSFNDLTGINASANGAIIRISNNEIYNNGTGISIAAGATINSAVNNRVAGNGSTASSATFGGNIPIQ